MEPSKNHDIEQYDHCHVKRDDDNDEKAIDIAYCHDMIGPKPESVGNGISSFEEVGEMRQGLHQRHIQMIALAGTIGTGLFLGSGSALTHGGPLGAFLSYTIVGFAVAGVCLAVGELGALVPLTGGMVRYVEIFFDPALSFADGWNQIYGTVVGLPAEMVAASVLVSFWIQINSAIWISVFGGLVVTTSLLFVRVYGELEFGFAILKIVLIIIANLAALVITCGGGPNGESIGFRYWKSPGLFAVDYLGYSNSLGKFMGFWATMSSACYAYSSIQGFATAAAETRAPRRSIPIAAKRIFIRILLFYCISIFMTTLVVPSTDPHLLQETGTASQSPFVIASQLAGVNGLPSVINVLLVCSAWSAGNSFMLSSSRTLYGMARRGFAPKAFVRLNRFSIPYVAVAFLGVFISLGYMTLDTTASTVFTWMQSLVAVSALVDWIVLLLTYLRFFYGCKAQGISRTELPWAAPFQPYISWAALSFFVVVIITNGFEVFLKGHWSTETFISSYFGIAFVVVLYIGYKFFMRTNIVPLCEMPIREFIDIANANPEEPPKPKKGLQKLNVLWE